MAKNEKITLTLDFNVEKTKLQEVSNILNKDMSKGLSGAKSTGYFNSIKSAVTDVSKVVNGLYSDLSKPLISKAQAKELASNLESAFKGLDSKLLSLQGSIGKTFNSTSNVAAIKTIREIGNELDKLTADYQTASQLLSKSRSLGNKGELKSQLSAASKELDILSKKQSQLTNEEKTKQAELKKTIKSINEALAEKLRLTEQVAAIQASHGVSSQAEMNNLVNNKMSEQQNLINGSISIQDVETLRTALSNIRDILKDIMATSNATAPKISENIENIEKEQKEMEEQARTFKSVLRDLGIPILTIQELASTIKKVVQYSYDYIKNLDKALTEISVVSNKSRKEVLALTDTFIELSAKTGMAIDDIAQASTIFYQQGLSDEAVKKMTEWTALFAKISGEDVPTAADQLTAAINGFGFAVDDVSNVVDKMSVLAAYSAADIDELATAMSKGASQAAMAGLTFDEYNAYLATMIETTREAPENLGTSLKTIMSRFQNIKTGDNTDDDTDINDVEKALKTVGVQLRDSEGQLRELGDVLGELGPKWNTLDRNTQAYIGTVVAGTRQQSRFVSLMQNWDRALELTTASENSAGAATKMHASAMKGLEASLNNLTNAWQKLISSLVDGDSFKWIIDTITGLVKWFGDGNTVLKLFTVGITLLNTKTLMTNLSLVQAGKDIKNLDTVTSSLGKQIKKLATNITSLHSPMSKESKEIERQTQLITKQIQKYRELQNAKAGGVGGANIATPSSTVSAGVSVDGTNVPTPVVKPDVITKTSKETGKFSGKLSKLGGVLKTGVNNVTSLIGGVQTGLMVGSLVLTAMETVKDWMTTSADEVRERAQKAFDATQKEIDGKMELVKSVEANVAIYDKLSKKLNKSTEEVEQLAKAAEALASVDGALIGYDSNGNPIINTNAARAAAKNAEKDAAEAAKTQMGNLGGLARADIRQDAEDLWASSDAGKGWSTAKTAGSVGVMAGLTTFGATMMLVPEPTMVTKVIGGISLAVAAIGALVTGTSMFAEEAGIAAEEMKLASETASKIITQDTLTELLKNMSIIANESVKDRSINGVSESDRETLANFLGNTWLEDEINRIKAESWTDDGKFDADKFEESFNNLGKDWGEVLAKIGDEGLANATKGLNEVADNIGDKTYASVESAIKNIVTDDMGITEDDELFTTIRDALMKAVYNGYENGIYAVVQDLESRKTTDLANSNYGEDTDTYKAIAAEYDKAINNVKNNLTNNQVSFYDMIGLTDDVGLFNSVVDQYGTQIGDALTRSTEAGAMQAIAILDSFKNQAEQKLLEIAATQGVSEIDEIDYDALTQEQQAAYDKWKALAQNASASIEKSWNSMEISIDIPWDQLWDDFEKLTKRAKTARETLASLASGEGIDANGWKDFTTMFDDIDFEAFDTSQLLEYAGALDNIAGSLEVVNGQIYANGEAVNTIAQLEEAAIQASIEATRQELINKQLELEASKSIIDAQVATLEWKIAVAEGSADAEQLKSNAEAAWLDASNKMNTFYVQNQGKVAEAMVRQYADAFSEVALKYNQMQTAMSDGTVTQDEINAIDKSWKAAQEKLNFNAYSEELDTKGYNLDELKGQLEAAKKASAQYQLQIDNIDVKLATLGSGLWSGENGVASGKKQEELNKYIGKLKEVYNIENRIALLEHRLSTLDTYSDIEEGDLYGKHLNQRIDLTNELLDQYEFLVSEEKKFANGYKDFIESSDLADVFDFDEFGQIIVDFDKYNSLQDEAADGQKSMKEQADEMYDTYTEMFEDLQDDFDEYISYLGKAIDLQQQIVDSYIEIETKAADAIKEIYQKILDTKLEAIDREKEALEELREERERARKDQENAEALSDLQTNIQRTMMDSSGASDISFIKAQNDMNDKLEEIADDKYSEMLDNIIERLEQEQDALQENFDEMFDNLDWLHEAIEEDMMTNETRLLELFQQTDEWKQLTSAERKQQTDEWKTHMATYMDTIKGGKTILDVCEYIDDLQKQTEKLDNSLKTQISQTGSVVANQIVSAIKSSGSGGGSSSSGGKTTYTSSPGKTVTATTDTSPTADVDAYNNTDTPKDNYAFAVGDTVKSNTGAAAKGYDGGENLTKPTKQNDNFFITGKWTVRKRDKYNGTNYYRIQGQGNGVYHWVNGHQIKYKDGGFANFTGPAWLDGTPQKPEAVLNALQTEHFIKFTNALDNMFSNGNVANTSSTVSIDTISFNVESMSSPEDGEAAFNMFVNKFKEIGSQSGIKIDSFKNRL